MPQCHIDHLGAGTFCFEGKLFNAYGAIVGECKECSKASSKPQDIPLLEALHRAENWVARGWTVFQTWNCKCGRQQIIEKPNHFYTSGRCEECGEVTDLVRSGCGFHAVSIYEPAE